MLDEMMRMFDKLQLGVHHDEATDPDHFPLTPRLPVTQEQREELERADQAEKDRKANLITYSISASTSNRKMTDDEREAIRTVMRETAMEMNVKLLLVLQDRYKLTFDIVTSNGGKRSLPLMEDDSAIFPEEDAA
jgi:hypothetical protein